MNIPNRFYRSILDSIASHVAVVNQSGDIVYVNRAWVDFGVENGCSTQERWIGTNYLTVCDGSATRGEEHATIVAAGMRAVISGAVERFHHEYPCHSDFERRWFMMSIMRLHWDGEPLFTIVHQTITERKLAEMRVERLSLTDSLTGIANRRRLDNYLEMEWQRRRTNNLTLTLMLIDLDHFKQLNDTHGHLVGDECLRQVGILLNEKSGKAQALAARFGGEEFAIVLDERSSPAELAQELLEAIRRLNISTGNESETIQVRASIGVATRCPVESDSVGELLAAADRALYLAKAGGRDRVVCAEKERMKAQ